MPGDAAPVVKVALIAPFEGLGRPLGYTLLPEVKGAIGVANAAGRFGRYRVALVALNDDLDPAAAAAQARALVEDDSVMVVLGPWTAETAMAVLPILKDAGIPVLAGAPISASLEGVRSLCPGEVEVATALAKRAAALGGGGWAAPGGVQLPAVSVVAYAGDAATGASDLLRWRAAGWSGTLVGGPDLFRPWLIDLASGAAEGTLAGACAPPRGAAVASSPHAVQLVQAGVGTLLDALATDIAVHRRPTRGGVAQMLTSAEIPTGLIWFRVHNDQWVPD